MALSAMIPVAAQATVTVYTSRAAFMSAIHYAATDTFDDLSGDLPNYLNRSVGDYSYSIWATQPGDTLYPITTADGGTAISNYRQDAWISLDNFRGGANALGIDLYSTDADGNVVPGLDDALLYYRGLQGPMFFDYNGNAASRFIGFTWDNAADAPWLLTYKINWFWPTMDNLTLGSTDGPAVPEPVSWAFTVVGFGAVGGMLRRRGTSLVKFG